MNNIFIILFALAAIVCAFLLQDAGHDSAISSTRSASVSLSNEPSSLSTHPVQAEFDPVSLASEMAAAASKFLQDMGEGCSITRGIVEKGDTMAEVLEKSADGNFEHYLAAARKIFPLRKFRAGQQYEISTEDGRLRRFEYEIDSNTCLIVEGGDSPKARLEEIPYEIKLSHAHTAIEDNLFQAVDDLGENPLLAIKIVELFGSEINFLRDIQPGDSFSALVEKKYRNGVYKGYGKIIAARFSSKGKVYEAFMFLDETGKEQYYTRKGENLKKTLLQAPLAVTRITSRFSNNRRHPILGIRRPHLGMDYSAPKGTPVKAVGDGIVTQRGWSGGFGNQIILRHGSGLESMYAHLSGYAKGLREGARVQQGQVIGYVGSTGLSTGSHLDFRLKQNGTFINPAKAINPRGASVNKAKMEAFARTVQQYLAWMDENRPLAEYKPIRTSEQDMTNKQMTEEDKKPLRKKRQAERKTRKSRRS